MKKLVLSIAVVAAMMSIASCSGTKKAEDKGAQLKAKIENCTNPDSLKIYVKQAQDYANKLIDEGKTSEAEAYLDEVAPAIKAKDPSAENWFSKAAADVDSVASDVADATKAAADSVAGKVADAKDAVSDAAANAKDAAANAADKTKSAVSDAASKAKDAASNAADKVKDALKK